MDVNILNANIPHTDDINACRTFHTIYTTDADLINDILITIYFFQTHNLFKLNNDHNLLMKCTGLGTNIAPAYANISLDAIETSFFTASLHKTCIYYRYIKEIFQLWPHDNDTLTHFLEHAINIHPKLKFTHEISITTLPFFDVSVEIRLDKIFTIMHRKPTDSNSYLHYTSCHPVHIKDSIINSQFLRCDRMYIANTSEHCKELTTHLLLKAYPIKVIIKQFNKETKLPRTGISK